MTDNSIKPPIGRERFPAGTAQRWLEAHVAHSGEACLVWPFSCSTPGYGQFMPRGSGKVVTAHRYMCELAHGDAPNDGMHAAHSCGNRRCVNPRHLSWKSPAENQLDRRAHGTNKVKFHKLTALQVAHIRGLKGKETSVQIAAKFGVTESNVRLILAGKTWTTGQKVFGGGYMRARGLK